MSYSFEQFKNSAKQADKDNVVNLVAYNKEKNLCLCDVEGGYKVQVCTLPVLIQDIFHGYAYVNYLDKLQEVENWDELKDVDISYEPEDERKRYIEVPHLIKKSGYDNTEVFRHIEVKENNEIRYVDPLNVNKANHKELTDFENVQIGHMFCSCLTRHLLQCEFTSESTYEEGLSLLDDLCEEDGNITNKDFLAQWLRLAIDNHAFDRTWNGGLYPVYQILPEGIDVQTEIDTIACFVAICDDGLESAAEMKEFLCEEFNGQSHDDKLMFQYITPNVNKAIYKKYKKCWAFNK